MKIAKLSSLLLGLLMISCSSDDSSKPDPDVKALVQEKLNAAIPKFPGLSLSVTSASGNYTLVAGDAVIGERAMETSDLHYMQSISKTFTAVAVLKLKEEGKINLDAKINTYLPAAIYNNLANGNTITVRQLMNMTSGLPDYLDDEQFFNDVLAGPLPMTSEQVLSYVYGKPANFTPGARFGYGNVNYHLLALIIDSVTESGHREYITNNVIAAAGLAHTYYIAGSNITSPPFGTTASYLQDGNSFTDISALQLGTVLTFIGDDGIVATPSDIADFYYKLLHDESLVSASSLAEMETAVNYQGEPIYGLGLHFYKTAGGIRAIGHEGSGAGAAAYAFYFPSRQTSVTLCTNVGTLTDPDKEAEFMVLWEDITETLLK